MELMLDDTTNLANEFRCQVQSTMVFHSSSFLTNDMFYEDVI